MIASCLSSLSFLAASFSAARGCLSASFSAARSCLSASFSAARSCLAASFSTARCCLAASFSAARSCLSASSLAAARAISSSAFFFKLLRYFRDIILTIGGAHSPTLTCAVVVVEARAQCSLARSILFLLQFEQIVQEISLSLIFAPFFWCKFSHFFGRKSLKLTLALACETVFPSPPVVVFLPLCLGHFFCNFQPLSPSLRRSS